jgi:hypothetical protein
LLETIWSISTKLCLNDPYVVPFQNCVHQRRPVSKMAAIAKNRNFIWKGAIQGSFHKSLVAIGPVVSEEKIFM